MEISNTVDSAKPEQGGDERTPGAAEQPKKAYEPFEGVDSSNPGDNADEIKLETFAASVRPTVVDKPEIAVEVTAADKNAFLDALVSGGRFVSRKRLFDGRVDVVFRSRSLAETEAILSYMQRNGSLGKFTTTADVQNASLLALLVAQVASLNGVEYAEMKAPFKYTETVEGVVEPAWVADMEIWRKKPEALLSALGDALVEFESKYWTMVKASKDENFWNPDGSTGK